MKKFRLMTAFVIALCLALSVCCALADQTLEGDANVDQRNYPSTAPFIHPPFYNVRLTVEVDDSGVITVVKDNGTGGPGSVQEGNEEFWASKNKPYFDAAVNAGLLDKFVGKTRDEVAAMDMTSGGTDAISGATMVSAAAQEAVLNAFDGKAGKTFLEVEGSVLPVEAVDGGVVTLVSKLPEDFDLQVLDIRWGVRNEEIVPADSYTVEIADSKVIITFRDAAGLKPGYYYVNVADASGKYRSPSFEGGPAAAQAPYFIIDSGLTAEDIAFDGKSIVLASGSMTDYLANIQHVQILAESAEKPVEQEIVGHHGTVGTFIALDENGVLNADGVVKARNGSESPLFEAGKQYTVTVAAFGYPELVFSYTKADVTAEAAAFGGVFPAIAGENGTAYVSLFDVIISDQWTPVWQDYIAAVIGEDAAPEMTGRLQSSITSELYGEAAVKAFADGGYAFDCDFINGAERITFSGNTATILKTDGTSETHTYEYLGQVNVGETETMMYQGTEISMAFPVDAYKSTDEAGEFNYFLLREDTMAETYHIEFRYGKDLEELKGYLVGPYAYWLAAGIDADADEETIRKVIALFCLENMDYSAHMPEALAQLDGLGFVGAWKADLSAFGEEYAGVDLSMTIDENGHGVTMMNGTQTADFEAYAVDNGEKGDGQGLYVAWSNLEFEAEAAPYAFSVNDNGQTVLTLTADDGAISWVKQGTAAEVIEIATAEELATVSQNLSGHYVLTADIDLNGAEWSPLGIFVPGSDENGQPTELPDTEYAFTGSFDGNGHTISNFTISQGEAYTAGLFGCLANASLSNLTVKDVHAEGFLMVSDVVGYAFMSTVSDVKLENGTVHVIPNEMSEEGMFGGIVGASMGSVITNCEARADIVIEEGKTANVGIVGGGWQNTSVANCIGHGSIQVGSNCYGIGGVSGCGFGSEYFMGCVAEDVTITVGDGCSYIGGITGYCGGYEPAELGVPVTQVTGCRTKNVTITTGEDAEYVGDFVGGGFLSDEMIVYGPPFDQPTSYEVTDCQAE